jgi:hypothetical protein
MAIQRECRGDPIYTAAPLDDATFASARPPMAAEVARAKKSRRDTPMAVISPRRTDTVRSPMAPLRDEKPSRRLTEGANGFPIRARTEALGAGQMVVSFTRNVLMGA